MVTLRDIQEQAPYLLWKPEIVSLNVIDNTPLLITRHEQVTRDEELPGLVTLFVYNLFTTDDTKWRPESQIRAAGHVHFVQYHEGSKEVKVKSSEIQKSLRGRGIGKYIYKTAVNDLLDQGATRVYSDSEFNRSLNAEYLWRSLRGDNPERIRYTDARRGRFVVNRYIERRPITVRRHRRRR